MRVTITQVKHPSSIPPNNEIAGSSKRHTLYGRHMATGLCCSDNCAYVSLGTTTANVSLGTTTAMRCFKLAQKSKRTVLKIIQSFKSYEIGMYTFLFHECVEPYIIYSQNQFEKFVGGHLIVSFFIFLIIIYLSSHHHFTHSHTVVQRLFLIDFNYTNT